MHGCKCARYVKARSFHLAVDLVTQQQLHQMVTFIHGAGLLKEKLANLKSLVRRIYGYSGSSLLACVGSRYWCSVAAQTRRRLDVKAAEK